MSAEIPVSPESGPVDPQAGWVMPSGARIGRFVVIRLLGAGAMGAVYEARDPELDRSIALKVLKRDDGDGGVRFVREAQALARLSHPNVVAVHDVGAADGRLFLAMEYVDGLTLDELLRNRRHTWRELLEMFVQAGRGLAAAHARSIIHRDFKPTNVLVDRDGRVRVTDFGLARLARPGPIESVEPMPESTVALEDATTAPPAADPAPGALTVLDLPLTQVGQAVGTPRYMAPEQRDQGSASTKSDQYSFCVALWEALFGEHPLEGTTRRLRAAPRWLVTALETGLSPDPARRHASMTELISLLERTPVRRRTLKWAGLAAILVGGAATWAVLMGTPKAPPPPCGGARALLSAAWGDAIREKVRTAFAQSGRVGADDAFRRVAAILDGYASAWVVMRTEACEATEVRHEQSVQLLDLRVHCLDERRAEMTALSQVLADRPGPRAVDNAVKLALGLSPLHACADAPALLAAVPPPTDRELRARVEELRLRVYVADFRAKTGKAPPALVLATEAAEAVRATGYLPLLAHALGVRGQMELRVGKSKQAEATLKEAVQAAAEGRDDKRVAAIWLALMFALSQDPERLNDALALEPVVRAALARAGAGPDLRSQLHRIVGNLLREMGKLEEAGLQYREALGLVEKAGNSAVRAELLNSMANLLRNQGKNDDAIAALEEARSIFEKTYGTDHSGVSVTLTNQTNSLVRLDRCEEAVGYGERDIALGVRVWGAEALVENNFILARAYACLHDEAGARAHFTRALTLAEREGPDTLRVAEALEAFGSGLNDLGRHAEAIPHLTRALAIRENKGDKVGVGVTCSLLGDAYLATGKRAAARRLSQRAVVALEHTQWAIDLAVALHGLAKAEMAMARPADAVPLVERALALTQGLQWRPTFQAHARLTLAQALWDSRRDRGRAIALAREAESVYAGLGARVAKDRDVAAAWLRAREPER